MHLYVCSVRICVKKNGRTKGTSLLFLSTMLEYGTVAVIVVVVV